MYRHLEPASAYQLELYRLKNFQLEKLTTKKKKFHLFLGKANLNQNIEYRYFLRSIVRRCDLVVQVCNYYYLCVL